MILLRRSAFAALLLLPFSHLLGQAPLTSLRGTILDAGGALVANAHVEAVQAQTGLRRSQETGDQGEYLFAQLSPGQLHHPRVRAGLC